MITMESVTDLTQIDLIVPRNHAQSVGTDGPILPTSRTLSEQPITLCYSV